LVHGSHCGKTLTSPREQRTKIPNQLAFGHLKNV
jgi:hypothetical protein